MTELGMLCRWVVLGGKTEKSSKVMESVHASFTTAGAPEFRSILFSLPDSMICPLRECSVQTERASRAPQQRRATSFRVKCMEVMFFSFIGNPGFTVSKSCWSGNANLNNMLMNAQSAAQDLSASSLFLSCDWGTSSFRLRLIDAGRGEKLAETKRDVGVKSIYLQSVKERVDRADLFKEFLVRETQDMLESNEVPTQSIRMMLSGMASSSIGWVDLPYARMPFPLDGSGAIVQAQDLSFDSGVDIDCRLISGVCSQDEMMRGE